MGRNALSYLSLFLCSFEAALSAAIASGERYDARMARIRVTIIVKTIRAMKLHTMIGLEAEVNLKKIPRITTIEANLQISAQMVC